MANLTKQQKLEMVSKAIDAGFDVELRYRSVESEIEFDEKLSIFEGIADKEYWSNDVDTTGIWINHDVENFDDKFEATIFIDSLRGESS